MLNHLLKYVFLPALAAHTHPPRYSRVVTLLRNTYFDMKIHSTEPISEHNCIL